MINTEQDLAEIGYVIRTHGVKGHIKIHLIENTEELTITEALFLLRAGRYIPYFIRELEYIDDETLLVLLEEIHSKEEASLLVKKPVYARRSLIVEEEEEEDPGYLGYTVSDEDGKRIGEVTAVYPMQEYDLLEMEYGGKNILIPVHKAMILHGDADAKTLQLKLPEGILDI